MQTFILNNKKLITLLSGFLIVSGFFRSRFVFGNIVVFGKQRLSLLQLSELPRLLYRHIKR